MNGVLIFRPPCTAQPYELLACGMLMFEPVPVPAPFRTFADVQLVDGGRHLSRAPGLVEARRDEVGHARAAGSRRRSCTGSARRWCSR